MSKSERSATLVPAVGAQVERVVGRLEPERDRVCEQGCNGCDDCTEYDDRDTEPEGCEECAWGKVLGCWRCGGL